jgi:hypothetical protein
MRAEVGSGTGITTGLARVLAAKNDSLTGSISAQLFRQNSELETEAKVEMKPRDDTPFLPFLPTPLRKIIVEGRSYKNLSYCYYYIIYFIL